MVEHPTQAQRSVDRDLIPGQWASATVLNRRLYKDERVYLQADAFGGYDGIYAGEAGGRVTEVACWAHARRKFYDARTSDPGVSTQALAHIRLLYDVENEAKKAAEKAKIDLGAERQRRPHRGHAVQPDRHLPEAPDRAHGLPARRPHPHCRNAGQPTAGSPAGPLATPQRYHRRCELILHEDVTSNCRADRSVLRYGLRRTDT